MINEPWENELKHYHARFETGHDRGREQLLASVDQVGQYPAPVRTLVLPAVKKLLAAAACLMILAGGLYMLGGGDHSQDAFATAINQFRQVRSVHLKMANPNSKAEASVEMWWRRPHDFRMEFSTGVIVTGNSEKSYTWDPQTNKLEISEAVGPGPEMMLLDLAGLGWLFADQEPLIQDNIEKSQIISNEPVNYKGETCRKITCQKDPYIYEYIIDAQADDQQLPFYQVNVYGDFNGRKLISHMEILEVDAHLPDDLFVIKQVADIR